MSDTPENPNREGEQHEPTPTPGADVPAEAATDSRDSAAWPPPSSAVSSDAPPPAPVGDQNRLGDATTAGTQTAPTTPLGQPLTQPLPRYGELGPSPVPGATPHAAPTPVGAPNRKRNRTAGVVAALVVGAVIGGLSGAGVTLLATGGDEDGTNSASVNPPTINVNDPDDATIATAVAATASPSVVTLSVTASSEGGTGSGVILSSDGYILTNTHVVTLDGASSTGVVKVTLNDGRIFTAKIVGTDPTSDLAVVKIEATGLPAIDFADSSKLNVGDRAIAIGAPLGLSGTVTDGIVSALNRSITIASSAVPDDSGATEDGEEGGQSPFDLWGFDLPGQEQQTPSSNSATISLAVIQTDAAINPGNSGGALLDADGKIIGINVAIASASDSSSGGQSGSIGVGFAIPANLAQRVAQEIIKNGSATHGLLGASIQSSDATSTDQTIAGAVVAELTDGGAAQKAGLQVGDIVTQFNGLPITDYTDLTAQVRALAAGSTATLTYVRDGQTATAEVTLGSYEP
jgi:putative serine protease PepD